MQSNQSRALRHATALGALCALLASGGALAADTGASASAQARYLKERAVCLEGRSNQDRATCLKEAGAALAEARRGRLDDGGAAYARNARSRCEALPPADRQDCLARMDGQGTTRGSTAAGGIYRELVTVTRETPARSTEQPAVQPPATPTKP